MARPLRWKSHKPLPKRKGCIRAATASKLGKWLARLGGDRVALHLDGIGATTRQHQQPLKNLGEVAKAGRKLRTPLAHARSSRKNRVAAPFRTDEDWVATESLVTNDNPNPDVLPVCFVAFGNDAVVVPMRSP